VRNRAARLVFVCLVAAPGLSSAQLRPAPAGGAPLERWSAAALVRARSVRAQQTPGQLAGQNLNPDISVIGELLTDLSTGDPKTTTEGERFEVREVELALQAAVDPYFRADFFLGVHQEAAEIEEAFLTALALPADLQARMGRFRVPLGKVNLIHRPEQITVDYPWVLREFFGDEGLASNGLTLSRIFAPFGFFQELQAYVISGIGVHEHDHAEEEDVDDDVIIEAPDAHRLRNQIAIGAQFRNFWDLSTATNLELGVSALTGRVRELEAECVIGQPCPPVVLREVFENQSFYGPYLTLRWRPLREGLYRSFIWNNELLVSSGHEGNLLGAFSQAQYQITRRMYLGARFDVVQIVEEDEFETQDWFSAVSGYFTFFPSEFSRFKLAVERTFGAGPEGRQWRSVLQTTFALGPHRPHAF
jgi:hypothetical protein